jgi:hypothetical protein
MIELVQCNNIPCHAFTPNTTTALETKMRLLAQPFSLINCTEIYFGIEQFQLKGNIYTTQPGEKKIQN